LTTKIEAEHPLDWFHVAMRLTVMNQMANGLVPEESESRERALKQLESIKWRLWHGNVFKALRRIEHLEADLEGEVIGVLIPDSPALKKTHQDRYRCAQARRRDERRRCLPG
jgi:hypothetical protein